MDVCLNRSRFSLSGAYIEGFAFWAVAYLDAAMASLPSRLIEYALSSADDPTMAVEALIRSLRPTGAHIPLLGRQPLTVLRDLLGPCV